MDNTTIAPAATQQPNESTTLTRAQVFKHPEVVKIIEALMIAKFAIGGLMNSKTDYQPDEIEAVYNLIHETLLVV